MKPFKSLIDFQKHFDTDEKCREFLIQQRWNGSPKCPHCGCEKVYKFKDGKRYNCSNAECKSVFSATVGTIYENTKLPLTKWFLATYILSVHSKGISSLQLAGFLGITQKSAWHLNHRIREMLAEKSPQTLSNMVEADETFIGGKESNKHKSAYAKRQKANLKRENDKLGIPTIKNQGRNVDSKVPVIGMVERGGNLIAKVAPDTKGKTLKAFINWNVVKGSTVVTDEWRGYIGLSKNFTHETVSHSQGEYERAGFHTNTIEGFWSLLKRQINGIHHFVSPAHLQRYCNEASWRYNHKKIAQDERFAEVISRCKGGLKYQDLIKSAN
jgi:transposase-like protein